MAASTNRDRVLDRYAKHVNKALASLARLVAAPVEVAAAGSKVRGSDGHAYLDCGGFGVFLLGHCHPAVVAAVREQLGRNPLATRLFLNPELAQAATDLAAITPPGLDYVFLTNSGAEATELGLKLARLAGKPHVIAMRDGFHGKTLGALSVTGRAQYRDPFGPLLPMVDFVPFGDPAALRAVLTPQSAVLLEPVQAEGGVRLPPDGYLRQVRQACTETGAVMILDEIQSGLGRLGAWWGADLAGVTPDALLTGKVLGGGVMPVGGVVASAQLFAPLNADPLLHSSTFAGSPLAAAAVTATIGAIKSEGLIERARELGPQVRDLAVSAVTAHCPRLVTEVRGQGLLIGVDFVSADAATEFLIGLLDEHVIPSYSLNCSNVLRLTPPAILGPADLGWLGRALTSAAKHVSRVVPVAAQTAVPAQLPSLGDRMRTVCLRLHVPHKSASEAYATLTDFERYPELSDAVQKVAVTAISENVTVSQWDVTFRAGLLRWTEEDTFDPGALTITFRQLEGDIALFDGSWECVDAAQGSEIVFAARLDMGIPSLADALEPIAVRTMIDNIVAIVRGLVGRAELVASHVAVPAGSES